jgi:hypothetical protein
MDNHHRPAALHQHHNLIMHHLRVQLPPADHPPSVTTSTVTARSTVTVTDTNRPLETQYSFHTPTVTATTPLATYVSYHCLNTLVVQYHAWEYLTWTWSYWEHTATTTGLCLTTSTRSTTIPGVTGLPAPDAKTLEDWEYFSVPGQSVATKNSVAIVTDTSATIAGTTTRTVCDGRNPSPVTTTTITVTRQSTTTKTVTGGGQCTTTVAARGGPGARAGSGSGAAGGEGVVEARQGGNTPVEVRTVVYTTVTVVSNTALTLTGTAVVDVNTQSFPVTRIAYVTRTGTGVVTATATVC